MALEIELPQGFVIVLAGILGLVFGSFVTALSYRLPRNISIVRGRSACPACGATLQPRDLVPFFSWLLARGACRRCGAPVSWRYPAIEVVTALLFVVAASILGNGDQLIFVLAMTPLMVALGVIDIEYRRLPNALLLPLAVLVLAMRVMLIGELISAVVAAITVFGLCLLLDWGGRRFLDQGLGLGDAKLMAIMALALPIPLLLAALAGAGLLGAVGGGVWRTVTKGRGPVPFGPALLISFWTGLLYL